MRKKTPHTDADYARDLTKVVGVRMEPRVRYLAELAARKQRRSLNSFIEWAIEESLGRVLVREDTGDPSASRSVADEAPRLWDVDEADRLAKLAFHYPDLLTHKEQVLWKLIRENGALWRGDWSGPGRVWGWRVAEDALKFSELRAHWKDFCDVAEGSKDKSVLPTWEKTRPAHAKPDDDIPSA